MRFLCGKLLERFNRWFHISVINRKYSSTNLPSYVREHTYTLTELSKQLTTHHFPFSFNLNYHFELYVTHSTQHFSHTQRSTHFPINNENQFSNNSNQTQRKLNEKLKKI